MQRLCIILENKCSAHRCQETNNVIFCTFRQRNTKNCYIILKYSKDEKHKICLQGLESEVNNKSPFPNLIGKSFDSRKVSKACIATVGELQPEWPPVQDAASRASMHSLK